ncbi:DUF6506 family protein [Actinophytocola oryzae]|uniref:Uncharacterized protein n=1 Tax=Actinophytocola oryzae TaxID=502181 RepID=A0A4R7VMJ3_9PSEU|nr:DUF6506 family protein [Actinophytocola oryzae]TDV50833.1 hypothetical protein CLV71_106177 [Actinophytocola oryzae]
MFRNLFLVRVTGAAPAERVVHADALSTTTIVPVPSVEAAVAVASAFGEVDLVELYGGLGTRAAAAVLEVAPGVPVGHPGPDLPPVRSAVLFEDPVAARWTFGATTVVTVPSVDEVVSAAVSLVSAGAERVELCGGMGPTVATAVAAVVDVPVTTVLFGFESLPAAAAYRARFEAS